ncbi:MAG: carbohydrate porin [Terracidiphilus sp.]|nr:carbohydrate porin [Terracidiphilus sp.]
MRNTSIQVYKSLLAAVLLLFVGTLAQAQSTTDAPRKPEASPASETSLEDLNFRGGDAAMPPFSESVLDVNSSFRRALLSKGLALRLITSTQYAQDILKAPASADKQSFVGDSPFGSILEHLILTSDLRQLGLHHAQLHVSGDWNWASWEPAGPKAFELWSLSFYKEFGKDRAEIKAGYNSNDLEFVGMQVGGSTASGVQGVYAVLPYEVGMAFFPLTAPQFNLLVHGPSHTYVKSGLQRSLDPNGGPATEARNHTGLRFAPKGDKLLVIEEAGFRRDPSATQRETWFRAGYLHNSTLYTDVANGKKEPGNHAAFALMDYQLTKPDPLKPWQGLYLGASAMTAASKFNPYDRYYEARLYKMAPFQKRPGDVASILSTYTGHSKFFTDPLVAKGLGVWRNSGSLTGSYNIHLAPGNFLSLGLSYIRGAAITPRVDDTVTFAASYSLFF